MGIVLYCISRSAVGEAGATGAHRTCQSGLHTGTALRGGHVHQKSQGARLHGELHLHIRGPVPGDCGQRQPAGPQLLWGGCESAEADDTT